MEYEEDYEEAFRSTVSELLYTIHKLHQEDITVQERLFLEKNKEALYSCLNILLRS